MLRRGVRKANRQRDQRHPPANLTSRSRSPKAASPTTIVAQPAKRSSERGLRQRPKRSRKQSSECGRSPTGRGWHARLTGFPRCCRCPVHHCDPQIRQCWHRLPGLRCRRSTVKTCTTPRAATRGTVCRIERCLQRVIGGLRRRFVQTKRRGVHSLAGVPAELRFRSVLVVMGWPVTALTTGLAQGSLSGPGSRRRTRNSLTPRDPA